MSYLHVLDTTSLTIILTPLTHLDTRCVQPRYPDVKWPKLEPFDIEDRGLRADPEKKSLLSAASKVVTLNPTIGTDIYGVDLRALTETQKDEL